MYTCYYLFLTLVTGHLKVSKYLHNHWRRMAHGVEVLQVITTATGATELSLTQTLAQTTHAHQSVTGSELNRAINYWQTQLTHQVISRHRAGMRVYHERVNVICVKITRWSYVMQVCYSWSCAAGWRTTYLVLSRARPPLDAFWKWSHTVQLSSVCALHVNSCTEGVYSLFASLAFRARTRTL